MIAVYPQRLPVQGNRFVVRALDRAHHAEEMQGIKVLGPGGKHPREELPRMPQIAGLKARDGLRKQLVVSRQRHR